MPNSVTPFADCVAIVSDLQGVVDHLNSPSLQHPLADVIALLDDVVDVLSAVPLIDTAWDIVTAATNAIGAALDVVTAFAEVIPGLDVVLDVLDGIYNFIDGLEDVVDGALDTIVEVVDEVLPILRDICTGLKDIKSIIVDMATALPALNNTLTILQALAEIVDDILPVFKGTEVSDRLTVVLDHYDTVNRGVLTAVSPLKAAFHAVEPAMTDLGNLASDMRNLIGGEFGKIEQGFQAVANDVASAEETVKGIARSLAPVRWVLDAVSSVMKKVIKPIIDKIMGMVGVTALEGLVLSKIETELGISAIQTFNSFNGQAKGDRKSDAYGQNRHATGSAQGQAMRDFWRDVGVALGDYKKGDKGSAVQAAVEALLDAITRGEIDLNATPPIVQKKTLQLYVPQVTPLPSNDALVARAREIGVGARTRIEGRRIPPLALFARASIGPTANATAVIETASQITGDLKSPPDWAPPLNAAAKSAIDALTTASPLIAPAATTLSGIATYTSAPPSAVAEIGAIAIISQSVWDTVNRLVTLYPDDTAGLSSVTSALDDLNARLQTLAQQEMALAPTLATAQAQVNATLKKVASLLGLSAHATSIAAIAASGASTTQLIAMMDTLNAALSNAYDGQMASVHKLLEQGAGAATAVLRGLVTHGRDLGTALQAIQIAGTGVLSYYQGIATYGTPLSQHWLPILLDAAKYAKAIDSVLAPLSYLLTVGGCATAPQAAEAEVGGIAQTIRRDALDAAHFIRDEATALLSDIVAALPKVLEAMTADALNLPQMEALMSTAVTRLDADLRELVAASGNVESALAAIAAGTRAPQTYSWQITKNDGAKETIEISNIFFTQADADTIGTLATRMVSDAVGKNLPLPDPSPLIQKWSGT